MYSVESLKFKPVVLNISFDPPREQLVVMGVVMLPATGEPIPLSAPHPSRALLRDNWGR